MKPGINQRFKRWYQLSKSMGVLSGQREIANKIPNSQGKPYTQSFISQMMARTALPLHFLNGLEREFPYTDKEYYTDLSRKIVNYKKLLRYIMEKESVTFAMIAEHINKEDFSRSSIAKFNEETDNLSWQVVFDYFNDLRGYNISVNIIEKTSEEGISVTEFTGKTDQVKRFLDVVLSLKRSGVISTDKEFCETMNISTSVFHNMKSKVVQQDVTKDMLVSLMNSFPQISIDWVLVGVGSMYRDDSTSVPALYQLRKEIMDNGEKLRRLTYLVEVLLTEKKGRMEDS